MLRTPEARFGDLPGYPFEPRYVTLPRRPAHALRRRGAGRRTPRPSCCCTASRRGPTSTGSVVARLVERGLRAVAPDLIGFGRSDKPVAPTAHSVQAHVDWTAQFTDAARARGCDARGPGLGRAHRPGRPGGSARAGPSRRGGQHRAAYRGRLVGRSAGLARARQRRRLGHRRLRCCSTTSASPRTWRPSVPACSCRGRRSRTCPRRSWPPTMPRFPTTPTRRGPAGSRR